MTPQNGTILDLSFTTAYVQMSVDNTVDKYVVTRVPGETLKPSSQPAVSNYPYSISTSISASLFALYPSAALVPALTSYSKRQKMTE